MHAIASLHSHAHHDSVLESAGQTGLEVGQTVAFVVQWKGLKAYETEVAVKADWALMFDERETLLSRWT